MDKAICPNGHEMQVEIQPIVVHDAYDDSPRVLLYKARCICRCGWIAPFTERAEQEEATQGAIELVNNSLVYFKARV